MQAPAPGTITMYSTTWCGYCRRLKSQLDKAGVAYSEVNIEESPEAAEYVQAYIAPLACSGSADPVPALLTWSRRGATA